MPVILQVVIVAAAIIFVFACGFVCGVFIDSRVPVEDDLVATHGELKVTEDKP